MGKRTEHAPGTFSWAELATTDVNAAKHFYGLVLGWEPEDVPQDNAPPYTVFHAGEDHVSGLFELSADQRAAGVSPFWMSHVTVKSADEAAARARELGGEVLNGPFDVADAGRMAVLRDPTGATFAVWEPRSVIGADRVNDPGCLSWNDLTTPDIDAASQFYGELFGWEIREVSPSTPYRAIRNEGRGNGGMMPSSMSGEGHPPAWVPYFNAGDLDAALARVEETGGRRVAGPMDVPAGRFAVVQDPQGAEFALWEGGADD